jgi:hypothetical protein
VVNQTIKQQEKEIRLAKARPLPRVRLDQRQVSLRKLRSLLAIERKYNWSTFFRKSIFEHFSELAEESHDYLEFYFKKYGKEYKKYLQVGS